MIKDWIAEYGPQNELEIIAAMREIMQEITLAALTRTNFFENAAFYGGTALRVFHGLDRYSEDLDFSLLSPNLNFSLQPYFNTIESEFSALGLSVTLQEKRKQSAIESAFLKSETLWQEIVLQDIIAQIGLRSNKTLKIKLEVDRDPPPSFRTESQLLIRPFSCFVNCFSLSSLFAGKLHALLFRKWKNRVKGRDWYDLEWYIRKGVPLDITHFRSRALASGDWKEESISSQQIQSQLADKIQSVSFPNIKEDVARFIPNPESLGIWSAPYFLALTDKMRFSEPNT
ncbi:MAG: nucleotidyl transferase AbiEii/AbiGii toxin family protein [Luteibaculum sp.]